MTISEIPQTLTPPRPEPELENAAAPETSDESLPMALQNALRLFDVRLTLSEICDGMPRCPDSGQPEKQKRWATQVLQRRSMTAVWRSPALTDVKSFLLPAVIRFQESYAVLTHYDEQQCRLILPLLGSQPVAIDTQELLRHYEGELLLLRPKAHMDHRAEDLVQLSGEHWFWHTIWRFKRYIFEAAVLSVVINVLVLAMAIFTMTVYNRVLPNQTYVTLWTMAIGVTLALFLNSARGLPAGDRSRR